MIMSPEECKLKILENEKIIHQEEIDKVMLNLQRYGKGYTESKEVMQEFIAAGYVGCNVNPESYPLYRITIGE